MSPRERVQQLQAIEDIREVQRLAAEIEALRGAREVEARLQDQMERARQLENAETGWRQSIAQGLLGDRTTAAWSHAVQQEIDRLAVAEKHVAAAHATNAKARQGWEEASVRSRLAHQFTTAASRKFRLQQEERRSAELVDQYLIRRDIP
ncbi:MAG TPA: hypothetical protein VGE05_11290 [Novosphingobium sp.]